MNYNPYNYSQFTYDNALRKFLKIDPNKNEIDFIRQEIEKTESKISYYKNITDLEIKNEVIKGFENWDKKKLNSNPKEVEDYLIYRIKKYRESLERTIPNLESSLFDYNIKLNRFKNHLGFSNSNKNTVDLSGTKGTEKIIYLKELGILDFLLSKEPFNLSTNALAIALSSITGEKTETLQSYLNPIASPTSGQKNNPLNNTKKVKKIKQSLINIGFKPQG